LNNISKQYELWASKELENPALNEELAAIRGNEAEIADRFYRQLEFGTGGLRGIVGAGTNRMNLYTVRRATQGLSRYLRGHFSSPGVCIAYDTRNTSREFALAAAQVLCANGVRVYLFETVRPTPMLSFAVRHLKASAGIVITASHNPREYNGYKVYGSDGGQITDNIASEIWECMNACDIFTGVRTMPAEEAISLGRLRLIGEDVDECYYRQVTSLVMRRDLIRTRADTLRIIYSPLNGSGSIPVRRVLKDAGFKNVTIVEEQARPDGNFPTTPVPNPEEPAVFKLALDLAGTCDPDLIFATDPDCDRIGVLGKNERGEFLLLSGNQTGALLCDYIIRTKKELGTLPANAAVLKTIVTTDLVAKICAQNGVALHEVLTGFKYIGETIGEWERTGEKTFLFGFEESCGYLMGDFVRDKDAVIASLLVAEMALYYKEQGLTLFQALDRLYSLYGFHAEKLISLAMPGCEGQAKSERIIAGLKANYRQLFAGEKLKVFEDYRQSVRENCLTGEQEVISLPRSEALKFIFDDSSWLVLRPSRTEPKIKLYLSARGGSKADAAGRLVQLERRLESVLP
jgi:phosphoglucomutase